MQDDLCGLCCVGIRGSLCCACISVVMVRVPAVVAAWLGHTTQYAQQPGHAVKESLTLIPSHTIGLRR